MLHRIVAAGVTVVLVGAAVALTIYKVGMGEHAWVDIGAAVVVLIGVTAAVVGFAAEDRS
jgi:hypothetical protein